MSTLVISSIIFIFGLGITLYTGNPNRNSYKAFCLLCLILTLWLICVFGAMISGHQINPNRLEAIAFWLKANAFVSSFLPWGQLTLSEAIESKRRDVLGIISDTSGFLLLSLALSSLTVTDSFTKLGENTISRGTAYYIHNS